MKLLDLFEKENTYADVQLLAFTKALAIMLAYYKGNDIDEGVFHQFLQLANVSQPLVKNVGFKKEFDAIVNFISKTKPPYNEAKKQKLIVLLKAFRATMFGRMNDKAKKVRSKLFDTANMPMRIKSILESIFSIINSESPSGWKNLQRNIAILNDNTLNTFFMPEQRHETGNIIPTYLRLIATITGQNKDHLSLNDYEKLKMMPPEIQEEWKEISRSEGELWRNTLIHIVRNYGQKTIPVNVLIEKLNEIGIPTWRIPKGFTGSYDEKGNMYLKDGRQLSTNQIGGEMQMYDDGNTRYVAKGQGVRVNSLVNYYTIDHATEAVAHKSDLIQQLIPTLNENAKVWRSDFMNGKGKNKMLGAIIETLYLTSGRMGSEDGAAGISVLRSNHIRLKGNTLLFNYT